MYSNQPGRPDIVLACAGDIPTQETIAAAWMLRRFLPDLKVRVVQHRRPDAAVPAGPAPARDGGCRFIDIFTVSSPVVFAFHGYPGVIHDLPARAVLA